MIWRAIALAGAATLALSGTAVAASNGQITVNGSAGATVPERATDAQQQAAYSRALSAAIKNAQTKAQMVAQQLSITLGPLQSFTELSEDYPGYCGTVVASTPAAGIGGGAGQLTPISAKHRTTKKLKKQAHAAAAETEANESSCEVDADVTLVYATG